MTPEKQDKTLELSKHWSVDSTPARNEVIKIDKDRRLSVLVGPADGINLILNMDKYKKMSVLVSLYHAVFTFIPRFCQQVFVILAN